MNSVSSLSFQQSVPQSVLTEDRLEYFDAISAELGEHGRKYRVADFAGRFSSSWLNGTGLLHSRMARYVSPNTSVTRLSSIKL